MTGSIAHFATFEVGQACGFDANDERVILCRFKASGLKRRGDKVKRALHRPGLRFLFGRKDPAFPIRGG